MTTKYTVEEEAHYDKEYARLYRIYRKASKAVFDYARLTPRYQFDAAESIKLQAIEDKAYRDVVNLRPARL